MFIICFSAAKRAGTMPSSLLSTVPTTVLGSQKVLSKHLLSF